MRISDCAIDEDYLTICSVCRAPQAAFDTYPYCVPDNKALQITLKSNIACLHGLASCSENSNRDDLLLM